MSKAIEVLKNEHEAILSSLQILAAIAGRLDRKLDVYRKDIWDFLGFLKEFADKCHHGKEEGILFPAMVKAGVPEKGGPIGVMLAEHTQGRELIKKMEGAASGAANNPAFSLLAREYVSLLQTHIQKENEVLFPSAEGLFSEALLDQIHGAFEQHEHQVIGSGRHEQLHELLRKLKQKYPA